MLKNYLVFLKCPFPGNINLNRHGLFFILFTFQLYFVNISSPMARTGGNFPDDVAIFSHDADICQYLAGEWDSSLPQNRKTELSAEMDKNCSAIYQRQEHLKKKYSRNKVIMHKLNSYEF